MKILSAALIPSLLLAAAVSAQTTVRGALATFSNYGNYARQGTTTSFRTVPANTAIAAGRSLSVNAGTSAGGVSTIVGWNQRGNVVSASVSEQGAVSVPKDKRPFVGGSTASASANSIRPGPHSLMLTIGGRAGTTGLMQFWASGIASDRGVGVKYAFDIGNDGRVDFAWGPSDFASKMVRVVIPRTGRLLVKITSTVAVAQAAGGRLVYKTGASVVFTPGPHCAVLPYGPSCGSRLSGAFSVGTTVTKFALSYTGSKNARGLIVFGTKFTRIPIPGSRCLLLTDPRVVAPFKTDALGKKSWAFAFPTGAVADVKIQGADFGGGRIHASNGLHAVCIK